ncbi:hypothetical protein BKA65DRAFT_520248 [Rhexocercosporidium sp. MPI-PUGE-AT-0058]|nr:hypothetical protein BKA65DRAFT_520248 [Rhexocercosporidium sp. MPI-PUGE-AT-0058]
MMAAGIPTGAVSLLVLTGSQLGGSAGRGIAIRAHPTKALRTTLSTDMAGQETVQQPYPSPYSNTNFIHSLPDQFNLQVLDNSVFYHHDGCLRRKNSSQLQNHLGR